MGYKEDRIIEFLPWARKFARSCAAKLPSHLDRDDLQSAGILGYLRAAARYDVAKGASFRGYCALRIRGAVLDELRRLNWAPRSVHRDQRRITRVTSRLIEELGRLPSDVELAAALGMDPADLATFQTLAQPRQIVSFDEVCDNNQGDDALSLAERLPDPEAILPEAAVLFAENRQTLLKCVGKLPKSEGTVISLHYLHEIPLREVAETLAVTPSRVSQLHHQALGRLRQSLRRTEVQS